MATINATLQRQYQRQRHFTRSRSSLCFHVRRAARNPLLRLVMILVVAMLCLMGTMVLSPIHKSNHKSIASPQTLMSQNPIPENPTHFQHFTTAPQETVADSTTTAWQVQQQQTDQSKYLVWTCAGGGCGGIGDRMLGILQAYCMAVCLDRTLVIDWTDDPNIIVSTGRFQPPEILLVALDDRSSPVLQRLEGIPEDVTVVGIKTNLWMGSAVVQAYDCWDVSSFDLNDIKVLQVILKGLFIVSSRVQTLTRLLREASGIPTPYAGVHLRTGAIDERANHFSKRATNWTAFLECGIDRCCQDDGSPGKLPLYIVSDQAQLTKQLMQQFQNSGRVFASNLNDTAMAHYTKTAANDDARTLAWAEWLILAESKCVLPTYQSKYSQSAGIYAGCMIEACNDVSVLVEPSEATPFATVGT